MGSSPGASGVLEPISALLDFFTKLSHADDLRALGRTYCALIRGFVPHAMCGLYLVDARDTMELVAAEGVSDVYLARYEEHGRAVDPVYRRMMSDRAPADNVQLMSAAEWEESELYREVGHLQKARYKVLAPVLLHERVIGVLAWASADGRETLSDAERELLLGIGRAVGAAVEVVRQREAEAAQRRRYASALDCVQAAVVISDGVVGTRTLNASARRLVGELGMGETLIERLTARAGGSIPVHSVVQVESRSGDRRRISSRSYEIKDVPGTVITLLHEEYDEDRPVAEKDPRLTRREHEIAQLVVDGMTTGEIAAHLTLSPHTVRQHLKQIYRKLDVGSRESLLRTLLAPHVQIPLDRTA